MRILALVCLPLFMALSQGSIEVIYFRLGRVCRIRGVAFGGSFIRLVFPSF